MEKCADCLYQGDKNKDSGGKERVFCLIRGKWLSSDGRCEQFRENADLGKEIRNQFASEVRQERAENRRLSKIFKKNFGTVLVTLILSFALFIAAVKFFEEYIF